MMQKESCVILDEEEENVEMYLDEGMIIMEANLEKDVKCSLISDWSSNENIIIGRGQVIGFRENQEDFENVLIGKDTILCGVFDGHCGEACARFISSKCLDEISQNIKVLNNNINISSSINNSTSSLNINDQVMEQTFAKLQADYIQYREEINKSASSSNQTSSSALPESSSTNLHYNNEEIISQECGTTANIILLSASSPSTIYSINCGDSRSIYFDGTKTIMLSRDHKPTDSDENCRIKNLGGKVDEESGRIDGFLSYSRSFGDLDYQPIVSYSPELKIMERPEKKSGAEFILIATDGLFEGFKSNEECTLFINEFLQSHNYVDNNNNNDNAENSVKVINELIATMLDSCVNERESMDNVTIQLVMFMNK